MTVADRSNLFNAQEILDLDNEISSYINLQRDEVPSFSASDRVDSNWFVPLWEKIEKKMSRKPNSFIKLCIVVMILCHSQAESERGFRYEY